MWILVVAIFAAGSSELSRHDTIAAFENGAQCREAAAHFAKAGDENVAKGLIGGYILKCVEMQKVEATKK
jgi:hypothetical protein